MINCKLCDPVFYLQSDAWSDFAPTLLAGIISSLFGFGGAYLLFYWGIKKEKDKEKEKDKKEIRDFFFYLKLSLELIIRPAISQANEFKRVSDLLKAEEIKDFNLIKITAFNFKWFEAIDKIKMQKAFFNNFDGTEKDKIYFYNQLLSRLSLLGFIEMSFEDDLMKFMERSNKFEDLFKTTMSNVPLKINDNVRSNYKIVEGNIEKLTQTDKEWILALKDWDAIEDKVKKMEIYIVKKFFIDKLQEFTFKHQPETNQLLDSFRTCNYAFTSLETDQKRYSQLLANNNLKITSSIKRLVIIINKMQ